jgi:hypothetical protein
MSEESTVDPPEPVTVPITAPAVAPAPAAVPAAAAVPVTTVARVSRIKDPWWQYLAVGLVGLLLGGLICGGVLVIIDHGNGRIGDRGRAQQFGRGPGFGPGFGPRGVGPGRFGPGGVRPRLNPNGPGAPAAPSAPAAPTPSATS